MPLLAHAVIPLIGFAFMLASGWGGQGERVLSAVRISAPPTLDGKLDDEAWRTAAHATGFIDPYTGQPAGDQTEAWLGYDESAIYVAFYCHDRQPEAIVAREIRPGVEFEGEDVVVFQIDPFYTRRWDSASSFILNALGTQNEDIAGGRTAKREWRGEWQAAAARVPDGWTVEMRIPWKILNYPSGGTTTSMGINFIRHQARTRIRSFWSNLTPAERPELIGVWQGVQPPKRDSRQRMQFLSYLAPEWDEDAQERKVRTGLDIRYALTPQLTGVASLNPDFRNIESAVEGIQFSRSERFVQETRPFFAEGGDFFDVGAEHGIGLMFYSRRIKDFDGGVKLFGKVNPNLSVGALTVFDGRDRIDGVFNLERNFAERGKVSLYTVTHHDPEGQNLTLGTRANLRSGNWELSGEWVRVQADGPPAKAYSASLEYSIPRWFAVVRYLAIEPDFKPALGFVSFTDRRGAYLFGMYENEYRNSFLRSIEAFLFANRYHHFDGSLFQEGYEVDIELTTRSDHALGLGFEKGRFEDEHDQVYTVGIGGNVSNRFRQWELSYQWGKRSDRPIRFIEVGITRRLFGHLDIGLSSSILQFDGENSQHILTIGWEFDARRALTGRLVQEDGKTNWYLAYRNSGFLGREIYLIIGDPNADRFTQRAALKMIWAF